MLCVSPFILICFQAVRKKIFLKTEVFILFSLKIRPLSPALFSSIPEGLCEGLLTKRFTTTMNLICERERTFLSIFTSTPVNQCL